MNLDLNVALLLTMLALLILPTAFKEPTGGHRTLMKLLFHILYVGDGKEPSPILQKVRLGICILLFGAAAFLAYHGLR
jgi:hypothetical protein